MAYHEDLRLFRQVRFFRVRAKEALNNQQAELWWVSLVGEGSLFCSRSWRPQLGSRGIGRSSLRMRLEIATGPSTHELDRREAFWEVDATARLFGGHR